MSEREPGNRWKKIKLWNNSQLSLEHTVLTWFLSFICFPIASCDGVQLFSENDVKRMKIRHRSPIGWRTNLVTGEDEEFIVFPFWDLRNDKMEFLHRFCIHPLNIYWLDRTISKVMTKRWIPFVHSLTSILTSIRRFYIACSVLFESHVSLTAIHRCWIIYSSILATKNFTLHQKDCKLNSWILLLWLLFDVSLISHPHNTNRHLMLKQSSIFSRMNDSSPRRLRDGKTISYKHSITGPVSKNKFNQAPTEQWDYFRPKLFYNYINLRLNNSQCTMKKSSNKNTLIHRSSFSKAKPNLLFLQ